MWLLSKLFVIFLLFSHFILQQKIYFEFRLFLIKNNEENLFLLKFFNSLYINALNMWLLKIFIQNISRLFF